jgi:uncharacterized protein (DUF488 family)
MIRLYTIGFTKKNAERFFTLLRDAGVRRVLDIRLNNTSQLAGFAKRDDLAYFLRAIGDIDYVELPALAPTEEIMDAHKHKASDWETFRAAYLALLADRAVAGSLSREALDRACLLCSEETPDHCHRRLAADYLVAHFGEIEVTHLI